MDDRKIYYVMGDSTTTHTHDGWAWYYGDCGVPGCFAEGGKWYRIYVASGTVST